MKKKTPVKKSPKKKKACLKLTINQKKYCDLLPSCDWNQTEAYIQAYETSNRDTARNGAAKLMKIPKVLNYVLKLKREMFNKIELDTTQILHEERNLTRSDIADLMDENGCNIPVHKLPENVRQCISHFEVKQLEYDLKGMPIIKKYIYKFWDKGQALNRLEKCLGMHADTNINLKLAGEVEGKVTHKMDAEEAARAYRELVNG